MTDVLKTNDESKVGTIQPQETELLRTLYQPVEEEGLDKFDNALSNTMHEFDV